MIPLQNSLRGMLNWFLRPESDHLGIKGEHQEYLIAKHLSIAYEMFENQLDKPRSFVGPIFRNFDPRQYQTEYLSPLVSMNKFVNENMADLVSCFLLHGSMATLDFVKGWSDVDTLVVVKRETLRDPDLLCRLRKVSFEAHKFLYRVDPLQHHGLIFVAEPDFLFFPSYYTPIPALKDAVLMTGGFPLVSMRDCTGEIENSILEKIDLIKNACIDRRLRHHSYLGEYLENNYVNYRNAMYQMKYYLGLIMLLPAQFLELQGQPCYKRDSFELARPQFSSEAWEIVEKASEIRFKWDKKEKHPFVGNEIPKWLRDDLGPDYFTQSLPFLNELEEYVSLV